MAYRQLNAYERAQIQILQEEGYGLGDIAKALKRSKSTISREISRNSCTGIGYKAEFAEYHAKHRRAEANKRYKIAEGSPLEHFIMDKLRQRWSPDEIRDDLTKQQDLPTVCNETIYAFIKERRPEFKQYLLILAYKHYRKRGSGKKELIPDRRWIDERPEEVELRDEIGHWEGDSVVSKCRKEAIATFAERASGYLLAEKMHDRTAPEMTAASKRAFAGVPAEQRKSCTNDSGPEFADHKTMEADLKMTMYFAHPYHSWERGTNENTNRLLRQFFPKGTRFSEIEDWELAWAVDLINHRPRKRLGYRTPHEVFMESVTVAL